MLAILANQGLSFEACAASVAAYSATPVVVPPEIDAAALCSSEIDELASQLPVHDEDTIVRALLLQSVTCSVERFRLQLQFDDPAAYISVFSQAFDALEVLLRCSGAKT